MRRSPPALSAFLVSCLVAASPACGDKAGEGGGGGSGAEPDTASDSGGDTGTGVPVCEEDAAGTVPSEAEWIVFDGQSNQTFSLADDILSAEWQGNYGVYDLNAVPVEGANGFKLERPGTVVAVQVQWDNIPEEETPVVAWLWPDFGSDGYMWDTENPITSLTRCLTRSDEGTWVDYVLPEPVRVEQPLHVFAGYAAGEGADVPEVLQEDLFVDAEPYYTGIRFFGVDDELYYLGLASPWYVWRVRLAVVYDDALDPADKPFQVDPALSVSSRIAWGDYDNDGDDDAMTNGPQLFRNEGDGTFTDVTATAIVAGATSNGGVWGDYDNDGCLDYFGQGGSYGSPEVLLHNNCDGTLSDVTELSGVNDIQDERDCRGYAVDDDGDGVSELEGDCDDTEAAVYGGDSPAVEICGDGLDNDCDCLADEECDGIEPTANTTCEVQVEEHSPTEASGWFDVDNDGWLDLYLANYECGSEYDYFVNYDDRVWRNNGDGTFTDWTEVSGIPQSNQAGRGVTTGDYDLDGDIDVFVSNYRLDRNFFLDNVGDGTLDDVAASNGTRGVEASGAFGHTIGAVFGDIDNDGDFDMVHANLAHPFFYHFSDKSMVLINDGSGDFTDEAAERGLYYRETSSNPTLFDADNDGDLDLFITNVYSGRDSDFYRNDGSGGFTLDNHASGLLRSGGWGAAVADPDNDGDLDLVAYDLFRNDTPATQHWLKVSAVGGAGSGGASNRSAIGAVVEVQTGSRVQLRMVSGGSGTGVQDSLTQHFGLGADDHVDRVRVLFPGGGEVVVDDLAVDQRLWVHEDGSSTTGDSPPSW